MLAAKLSSTSFLRWGLRHVADVAITTVLAIFLGWLFRKIGVFSFKLGENAVLGVIDDWIANHFGLTAPSIIEFIWNWCVPPALAIVAIWAYHISKSGGSNWRSKLLALALMAIGGLALLAGMWLLVNSGTDQTAVAAAANPTVRRDPMLTGRPISGLEVVQRLQQVETELDSTKLELRDTQQQLAKATRPDTATPSVSASLNYTPEEKTDTINALRELQIVASTLSEAISAAAQRFNWYDQNMEITDRPYIPRGQEADREQIARDFYNKKMAKRAQEIRDLYNATVSAKNDTKAIIPNYKKLIPKYLGLFNSFATSDDFVRAMNGYMAETGQQNGTYPLGSLNANNKLVLIELRPYGMKVSAATAEINNAIDSLR